MKCRYYHVYLIGEANEMLNNLSKVIQLLSNLSLKRSDANLCLLSTKTMLLMVLPPTSLLPPITLGYEALIMSVPLITS